MLAIAAFSAVGAMLSNNDLGVKAVSYTHLKIILLYNEEIYATADVISSFVYRKGLLEYNWGFSTAVGLFNSVINFALVIIANKIYRKTIDMGLW